MVYTFCRYWFWLSLYYLQLQQECGGRLKEEPCSCYCIELVFPEMIDNLDEIDSDLFKADFIQECINNRELLDLEEFRYTTSVDIVSCEFIYN